ncbi:hypothetical protein HDU85_001131 [Gaertneriomyces sp. JEL0708]|nr:hypothetical protein HDU85_001131 [Gaertneriomyces sp. JEL0708]
MASSNTSLFGCVDYILVAEFDIDKGSSLTYQYPSETGTDAHMLAELMLPDGAHLREEDWTMFFLNQNTTNQEKPLSYRSTTLADQSPSVPMTAYEYMKDTNGQLAWSQVGPNSTIVVQLGDICVVTAGPRLAELEAIDVSVIEYRRFAPLCAYLFIEDRIWAVRFDNEEDEIYFLDFLDEMNGRSRCARASPPPPPLPPGDRSLTYVLNLVRTKHIEGIRRGARVKAMAIASRYQWVHVFKPLLLLALDKFFLNPSITILASLYAAINTTDISSIPRLSLAERKILRTTSDNTLFEEKFVDVRDDPMILGRSESVQSDMAGRGRNSISGGNKDRHWWETKMAYDGIRVPIRIPLTLFPEEIGDFTVAKLLTTFAHPSAVLAPGASKDKEPATPISGRSPFSGYYWHPHLDTGPQTPAITILHNALFTEKRVIFLGDKRPSGEVAQYVLAACAIAGAGVLRGYKERCWPYVSLAGLDALLNVSGYIAGVTNPVFEEQTSWWDVLCNINTGKITISPKLIAAAGSMDVASKGDDARGNVWDGDVDFVADIMLAIQSHLSEHYLRHRFHSYVQRLVDVCVAYERQSSGFSHIAYINANETDTGTGHVGTGIFFSDDDKRRREIGAVRGRLEGWRNRLVYRNLVEDTLRISARRSTPPLRYLLAPLRLGSSLPESDVTQIFLSLQDSISCGGEKLVLELLGESPAISGGLGIAGRKLFANLNPFLAAAYRRAYLEFYRDHSSPQSPHPFNLDPLADSVSMGTHLSQPIPGKSATPDQTVRDLLASSPTPPSPHENLPVTARTGRSMDMTPSRQSTSSAHTPPSQMRSVGSASSPIGEPQAALSPVVRRLLMQQQAKQEEMKRKLMEMGSDVNTVVEDVLNPNFAKSLMSKKQSVTATMGNSDEDIELESGVGNSPRGEDPASLSPRSRDGDGNVLRDAPQRDVSLETNVRKLVQRIESGDWTEGVPAKSPMRPRASSPRTPPRVETDRTAAATGTRGYPERRAPSQVLDGPRAPRRVESMPMDNKIATPTDSSHKDISSPQDEDVEALPVPIKLAVKMSELPVLDLPTFAGDEIPNTVPITTRLSPTFGPTYITNTVPSLGRSRASEVLADAPRPPDDIPVASRRWTPSQLTFNLDEAHRVFESHSSLEDEEQREPGPAENRTSMLSASRASGGYEDLMDFYGWSGDSDLEGDMDADGDGVAV